MNACDGIINQLASWQSLFCQGGSFRKLHGMCVTATLRQSSSDSGLDEIMAQPELSETLKTKLLDSNAIPRDVTLGGITYTVDRPVTAGFKGAVWQVKDHFGRPRALKLAIEADYETRSYLQEISYIAKLDAYPQFARFVDAGIVEIEVANDHHRFV